MKHSPRSRKSSNFSELVQQLHERSRQIASCVFVFLACMLISGIASAAPSITLLKKSGPPTSQILAKVPLPHDDSEREVMLRDWSLRILDDCALMEHDFPSGWGFLPDGGSTRFALFVLE
jgi:hypothetical protein